MVIADYDKGKKGSFNEEEAAALKKGAFDNLRNYHYFLALFVDGKQRELPRSRTSSLRSRRGAWSTPFRFP